MSLSFFLVRETAVIDAPACKLLPAVERHGGRADHDLVKFVGHGVAVGFVSSNFCFVLEE